MLRTFVTLALVAFAYSRVLESNCDSNSDCADNECCVAMDRYFIVSRRDLMPMPVDMSGGICNKFIKEGASCHDPGFTSCGCEPGTKCVYYPSPKGSLIAIPDLPMGKRDFFFRPGKSFCEKPKKN